MGTTFRKRQDGKPQSVLAIRATAVDEVYHGGPQYRGQLLEPICHYSLMWVTEPSDSSQNQVRFGRKNPQLLRGHPDQQKQKLSCFQLFWGALRVPPTPKPANLDCIKHSRVFFFFLRYIYFGCGGSLLLWVGFLQWQWVGATLHCGAWASHCDGFSCCGHWL